MTVVFSIAHMNLGGAQRVCYNLIHWLISNTDLTVHLIVCSDRQDKESFELNRIPHTILNGGMFKKIYAIRKVLKRLKPDLLVTMGVPQAIFDVPATLGLGIKHIISERNDPAHFGGRTSVRIFSRLLMHWADGYVFQTHDAQNYYAGRIAKKSAIIPNPLFNTVNMPKGQYEGEVTKLIVSAGRLNKQKNHPLLIRAYKKIYEKYPDYKLVIYGEGPERSADEEIIKKLGLEGKVLLPGATTKILEFIYNATLFVLPSDFEGMPNALMEAMALGLPCISTNCPCGGPGELIKDGENGLLVPIGDKEALVLAMEKMINNRDLALQMGRNALKIRNTHSMDVICKRWLEYFSEVAGGVKEVKVV